MKIEEQKTVHVTIHSRKRERALEGRPASAHIVIETGARGRGHDDSDWASGMAEVDDASAHPAVAAIAIREFPRRGLGVVATAPTAAGTTQRRKEIVVQPLCLCGYKNLIRHGGLALRLGGFARLIFFYSRKACPVRRGGFFLFPLPYLHSTL